MTFPLRTARKSVACLFNDLNTPAWWGILSLSYLIILYLLSSSIFNSFCDMMLLRINIKVSVGRGCAAGAVFEMSYISITIMSLRQLVRCYGAFIGLGALLSGVTPRLAPFYSLSSPCLVPV